MADLTRIPLIGTPWLVPDGQGGMTLNPVWFRWLQKIDDKVSPLPPPAPTPPPPPLTLANIQFQDDSVNVGPANPLRVSFDANIAASYDTPAQTVRVTGAAPTPSPGPWQGQQTFWVTTTAESATITGNLNVSATFGSASKPTVADTNWLTRQPRVVYSSPGAFGLAGVQGGGGVFPIQLSSGPGGSFSAELMHGTGPVWPADAGYFAGISSAAPLNPNLDADPINYIGMYLQGGGTPSDWRTIAKTAAGAAVTTTLPLARASNQIFIQKLTFAAGSATVHQTIFYINNTTAAATTLFDADMTLGLPAAGVGLEVNIALRENVIACDMHFMRATIVIPQP